MELQVRITIPDQYKAPTIKGGHLPSYYQDCVAVAIDDILQRAVYAIHRSLEVHGKPRLGEGEALYCKESNHKQSHPRPDTHAGEWEVTPTNEGSENTSEER